MTIDSITIKLFGKKITTFRVLNSKGEVVYAAETKAEAEAFIFDNAN